MNVDDARQQRLLAGLCHLAVLLPFAGALVPFIIWIARRNEGSQLRFQALQALTYQGVGIAGYVIYYAFSIAAGVASIPVSLGMAAASEGANPSLGAGELLLVLYFLFYGGFILLGLGVQCVLWPAYIGLGIWAGVKTLQGHEFVYPILGRQVGRFLTGGRHLNQAESIG